MDMTEFAERVRTLRNRRREISQAGAGPSGAGLSV